MNARTPTLSVITLVVAYFVVTHHADRQDTAVVSSSVSAGYPEPYADHSSFSQDCPANTALNPFSHSSANCDGWSDALPATADQQANTADASAIGNTLRELAQCNKSYRDGRETPALCSKLASTEASLTDRLEYLSGQGNSQARFELAIQLQRQAQSAGRRPLNAADIAENTQLQRAVALLAEAVAAGNPDAQRFKDAMGDHARLLHTGR
ncbi:MAG: hypothetical protein HY066_13315 [Betaproteobacteria bacterium]|nr:hypothetical protein [Betaproteobacteria bacterium]